MTETFLGDIFQGLKHPHLKRHTSIPFKQPKFGLWSYKILNNFEISKQNLKNFPKHNNNHSKYWEMRLSFYDILKSQTTPIESTHLSTIQRATIWSLELGNIKGLLKKFIECEKITNCQKNTSNTNKCAIHSTILKGVEREHPQ